VPLSLPQDCDIVIPSSPPDQGGVARFTRPPLNSRGCCAGDVAGHAQVQFVMGEQTPPTPPPPAPRGINLRTNTGRCVPLALPQDCGIDLPAAPDNDSMVPRFTRPPIVERGCCVGETDQVADVRFDATGEPLPPAPPPPAVPVARVNLRTTTGRCTPLAAPQECDPGTLADVTDASVAVRFTRPPLSSRACCSGDQARAPQVTYDLTVVICEHIALEDGLGFFALENDLGTFLLECAP
jgi:hypothetical protein